MDLVTTTASTGFELVSEFRPTGDQPQAIDELIEGLDRGLAMQTMLGATGSGKTFTMANIIARHQRGFRIEYGDEFDSWRITQVDAARSSVAVDRSDGKSGSEIIAWCMP